MLLWHYDFPNFPGGDPPDPLDGIPMGTNGAPLIANLFYFIMK